MGRFNYGSPAITVEFDDRFLAHLKVVVLAKFRRGESFTFSWEYSTSQGSGHSSVWLNPTIPLQFEFLGQKDPLLNRVWLEQLVQLANTPAGLRVIPEPPNPDAKSKGSA